MNGKVLPKKDDAIDQSVDTPKQEIKIGQGIAQTGNRQAESGDELPSAQDLEAFVENEPNEAKEVLNDTPLEKEADQILDDCDKRNDEVSNIAVNKTLGLLRTRPNFHENDPAIERMQKRIDRLAEKNIEKDEDFLGPDEYIEENGNIQVDPNWKPEDADEDFAGPDELPAVQNSDYHKDLTTQNTGLAPINSNLPEEITHISVETPVEEPEIKYSIEETREPGKPEEVKDDSHIVGIVPPNVDLPKFNSKGMEFGDPENTQINPVELQRSNLSNAGVSTPKSVLGNIGKAALRTPSIVDENRSKENNEVIGSSASKAPTYDKNSPEEISKAVTAKAITAPHNQTPSFLSRGMLKGPSLLGKGGNLPKGKMNMPNGEFKGGDSVLQAPDMSKQSKTGADGILALKDQIISKSKNWPEQRLQKDGLVIAVSDDEMVSINRKPLETAIKENPKMITKIEEIINA